MIKLRLGAQKKGGVQEKLYQEVYFPMVSKNEWYFDWQWWTKRCLGVKNCLSKGRGQEKTPWHVWETAKGDSTLNPCIPVGTVSAHRPKVSAAGVETSHSFEIYKVEIYPNYITWSTGGKFWRFATIWKNSRINYID